MSYRMGVLALGSLVAVVLIVLVVLSTERAIPACSGSGSAVVGSAVAR